LEVFGSMIYRHSPWLLLALIVLLAAALLPSTSIAKRKGDVEIYIVSTTDVKGELEPCG
jgi:hypothetical protein